jgi:predicted ATPase
MIVSDLYHCQKWSVDCAKGRNIPSAAGRSKNRDEPFGTRTELRNGALAEALAGTGQFSEALTVVDEAVGRASRGDRDGQMWYLPELFRIKGELLVQQDTIDAAEDCFTQAMQLAREQGALLWELRVALSAARSRLKLGRPNDAKTILAPVYDRIKESFATADMQAARALLDSLP